MSNTSQKQEERKPLLILMEELWAKHFPKGTAGSLGWEMMPYELLLRQLQKLVERCWYEREIEFKQYLSHEDKKLFAQHLTTIAHEIEHMNDENNDYNDDIQNALTIINSHIKQLGE